MMTAPGDCRHCGGRLESGFLRDLAEKRTDRALWVEGEVEKSFWGGVKTRHRRQLGVRAYRCTRCGLLQLYAEADRD